MQEQLQSVQRELRIAIENSGNTLAAYMGELEDRIERHGVANASSRPGNTPPAV